MRQTDIAWLAGIVEGEGCIFIQKRGQHRSILLQVAMTDEDVIQRVADLFGTAVTHRRGATGKHKDVYTARVWASGAAELLADMYDHFGERRKAKALQAMTAYGHTRDHKKLHDLCKRGHRVMEAQDVYDYGGKTWCKRCRQEQQRRAASMAGNAPGKRGEPQGLVGPIPTPSAISC